MKTITNYPITKIGWIDKLLYRSAGADIELLRKCSYSTRVMYFCLGGIVLTAGILAALSGGYAIYTVFSPKAYQSPEAIYPIWIAVATVIGSFYGYIIYNLERYIVSSTGKGDGTDNITAKEFRNAIPRILLSTIIAITVAKPLEVRIFQSEIDAKLNEKRIEYRDNLRKGVDAKFKDRLTKLETDKTKAEAEREKRQKEYNELQQQYIEEARIVTVGPRARALKVEVEAKGEELKKIDADIKKIEEENKKVLAERETERSQQDNTSKMLDGLLERIMISHEIGGWIPWFITLLFWALDVTPIFFKMMLIKNTYDYLQENQQLLILANNSIEIRPEFYKTDENGNAIDHTIYYEPNKIIEEKAGIATKQITLIKKIINNWFGREDKRIDENLDNYIEKPIA